VPGYRIRSLYCHKSSLARSLSLFLLCPARPCHPATTDPLTIYPHTCTASGASPAANSTVTSRGLEVNAWALTFHCPRYVCMCVCVVGPQLLPIAFNAETANEGDSVSVACSVLKGDMPMDIEWAFNGSPIRSSADHTITINRINKHLSTLSVDGAAERHAGEYSCTASNVAGSVGHTTVLAVNGTFIYLQMLFCISVHPRVCRCHCQFLVCICHNPNPCYTSFGVRARR
jgi:hypothetical protein